MVSSIVVASVIASGLWRALRPGRRDELIVHRPYNNRSSDATAARDYALFEEG